MNIDRDGLVIAVPVTYTGCNIVRYKDPYMVEITITWRDDNMMKALATKYSGSDVIRWQMQNNGKFKKEPINRGQVFV